MYQQVLEEKRSGGSLELKLRVEKFNADGSADENGQQWQVPLLVGTHSHPRAEHPQFKCLLSKPVETIEVPVADGQWVSVCPLS